MKTLIHAALLSTLIITLPAFAQDVRINIKDFMFAPTQLNIPVGSTVTWVNDDQIPHTVMETHKAFHSAALDTDDSFTFQFDNAGTFEYFCALHPQMIGRIVVGG
ncbi:cupredoxin family copper-binding protein [Pseudomonas sp. NPDC090203]|jgi:plastocyanin|uniref:cupredoxin domain-containing protein n=1 Tax=Pseudomonas TaxID=286 RepID=UPI0023643DCD|nr:cupredoxin family copper-binding protein [Pseudomonas putida]MDD1968599.1 cupredoxin family copper-binding protein [Pseudomonas putida]